jgi:hypothetical protein
MRMHYLEVRMTIARVWIYIYIYIWDPGTDDSSRLNAQEDTTAHTEYSMIQRELVV